MGNNSSHSSSNKTLSKSEHNFNHVGKSSERNKMTQTFSGPKKDYPDFLIKLAYVLEEKSKTKDNQEGIREEPFKKYISKASLETGSRLFAYFKLMESKNNPNSPTDVLLCDEFEKETAELLTRVTDAQQLEYFIKVFALGGDNITSQDYSDLITSAYEIAQFAHHSFSPPDDLLSAITKATMHGKEQVSCKYAHNWLCQHCPRIVLWMHRYITHTLTVGHSTIPRDVDTEEEDNETPVLDSADNSSCASLHPALVWLLSCSLPTIYSKSPRPKETPLQLTYTTDPHKYIQQKILADAPNHWVPLYNSDNHGLSSNRFQHHVFDYHGPTLIFVSTMDSDLFCVAADEGWKDSKHFFGGNNTVCMQLIPEYKIIEKGPNMLYYNQTSRGFPLGIQVGAVNMNRALTINGDLSLLHYKNIPYRLQSIEVWGCGSVCAKEKQTEIKRVANKDVERNRRVNLAAVDWKENPDRYLIELGGRRPSYGDFAK